MKTFSELAGYYAGFLQTRTRSKCDSCDSGGESFVHFTDGAPSDFRDMVREAHGGSMPDDYVFEFIEEALDAFCDADIETPDDAEDSYVMNEIEPDVYTHDLTKWLHSNVNRVYYLEQAQEEFGQAEDGFKLLSSAQYLEKREVFQSVLDFLREKYEEQEDEPDLEEALVEGKEEAE